MSASTKIEWTRGDDGAAGATWNPVTGCTKVSEGCDNCYAETFAEPWRGIPGHPFEQGFDIRRWPDRLEVPLRRKKPTRYFVNSMSDLWHDAVGTDFLARVFAVMAWPTGTRSTYSPSGPAGCTRCWPAGSSGAWCAPRCVTTGLRRRQPRQPLTPGTCRTCGWGSRSSRGSGRRSGWTSSRQRRPGRSSSPAASRCWGRWTCGRGSGPGWTGSSRAASPGRGRPPDRPIRDSELGAQLAVRRQHRARRILPVGDALAQLRSDALVCAWCLAHTPRLLVASTPDPLLSFAPVPRRCGMAASRGALIWALCPRHMRHPCDGSQPLGSDGGMDIVASLTCLVEEEA